MPQSYLLRHGFAKGGHRALTPLSPLFFLVLFSQGFLLEELPAPVLSWQHGNPLCSQVRAVDNTGSLWHDEGCENGRFTFEPIGQLSTEEFEALQLAFDSFPAPPVAVTCGGGMAHRFALRNEDGEDIYWAACGSSRVEGRVDGLAGPFLDAARLMGGVGSSGDRSP